MADILHMRIFGNVLPVGSHGSIFQLWDVRASIVSLFEGHDFWILLYFVTALVMAAFFRVRPIGKVWVDVLASLVPAAALFSFVGLIRTDVSTFLDSKWAKEVLNREDQVWNSGFLEAHIREISLNIKHALEKKQPTQAELDAVEKYYKDEHAAYVTKDRPSFGQFKGKNLLVIQIEAFEEWLVGATINGQEITPTLNRLRQKAVYYPNIFNLVATTPTADCEYLFLNSNHPLPDGAVAFRREDNHFVTLATTLRDAGYSTLSMHGYRKGMWNRAVVHPRYGFTHSLFADEIGMTPLIGWGLDDHVLMTDIVKAIQKEPKPWFVYAITLSSHHPYNAIPWNRRRLKVGPLEGTMVGDYMHSAAFVDDALGQLFRDLEASGILKDTMVVMYGDHDGHLHASARDRQNIANLTNLPKSKADYIGAGGAAGASDKTESRCSCSCLVRTRPRSPASMARRSTSLRPSFTTSASSLLAPSWGIRSCPGTSAGSSRVGTARSYPLLSSMTPAPTSAECSQTSACSRPRTAARSPTRPEKSSTCLGSSRTTILRSGSSRGPSRSSPLRNRRRSSPSATHAPTKKTVRDPWGTTPIASAASA
jgi:hypothetical protein